MSIDPQFEQPVAQTAEDRRKESRRNVAAKVSMTIDNLPIEGITDNMSMVGMLFFSQDPIRVSLELDEGGQKRVLTGQLVRAQRMKENNTGFAVEFDSE